LGQHEIMFFVMSYIIGSIPTGFLIFWIREREDIRKEGSGNTGATNIHRTCGGKAAVVTLVIDVLKGSLPVIYGLIHFKYQPMILGAGALAVIGHIFPVWLKFRGGKGVATFVGVLMAYMGAPDGFWVFPAFVAAFLITIKYARYVSAASMAGVVASFFAILFTHVAEASLIIALVVILIIIRHRENIRRIISGSEDRFQWRKNG